jgi:hypothetical protein
MLKTPRPRSKSRQRARDRDRERGRPRDNRKAEARLVEGQITTNWKQALAQLALAYPDRIVGGPAFSGHRFSVVYAAFCASMYSL